MPCPAGAAPETLEASLRRIAHCAVRALYAEVVLEPKPGLVSLRDNGSHSDMQAATFVHSLFALRHYFGHMARAGAAGQPFATLQGLGLVAEARMLAATGGINTHRGAVFALGLLCAAAGRLARDRWAGADAHVGAAAPAVLAAGAAAPPGLDFSAHSLRACLLRHWGAALVLRAEAAALAVPVSNGQRAVKTFGLRSAGAEAALGFPTLFEVTLPTLQAALQRGHPQRAARVQALFATMAVLDDTNLAHRGGMAGVQWVKTAAQAFLQAGGVDQPDWLAQARTLHAQCVAQRLSPGGAADVLACACWWQELSPLLTVAQATSTQATSAQAAMAPARWLQPGAQLASA